MRKLRYNTSEKTKMNNLRYYRLLSGKTVKKLAEEIGRSPSSIYSLENGYRNPKYLLPTLADVFDVPENILLKQVKKIKVQSRLRELRIRAKKTLEEIQLQICRYNFNITKQYLSLLEHNKCKPSPKIQNALADYFSNVLKKNITPRKLFPVIYE